MIWALLLIPTLAGLAAFGLRRNGPRRALLLASAAAHLAAVVACWRDAPPPIADGWIAVDPASLLFLSITSALFLAAAVYGVGYLAQESHVAPGGEDDEELPFQNFPEAVFTGCLLLFLATMSLVAVSQHLGLMWVGVEATTLVSAPLIYFHRHHRSLEATWKYLLICSVGIALALLGNFFVAVAARSGGQTAIHLTIADLTAHADSLNPRWLQAAFLFFLVGYGTKMGLAPLHTWLPDAHSEAPSVVSALLSGALLNCAFLTILRTHGLLAAAGLADFSSDLLIGFGLLSMAVAAVFIVGQADFKRMLAYSSVEHMGILSLGIGVGGAAAFGAMLHAVNHSLTKAMLFLAAGNILALYRTKSTVRVRGVLRCSPITGVLWMAGFLAIVGSPPFGLFLSELTILKGMFDAGRPWVAAAYVTALAVVFVGMAAICLRMSYGLPPGAAPNPDEPAVRSTRREPFWAIAPIASLGALVFLLGVYVPPPLADLLHRAAVALGAN
ncbi:MAG: proton-conducting transporter membrane subunit [Thermoguttaceae bacterium]